MALEKRGALPHTPLKKLFEKSSLRILKSFWGRGIGGRCLGTEVGQLQSVCEKIFFLGLRKRGFLSTEGCGSGEADPVDSVT